MKLRATAGILPLLLVLGICASCGQVSGLSGGLDVQGADPGGATVCLIPEVDPRPRAAGNVRAVNLNAHRDVRISGISLVGASNVRTAKSWATLMDPQTDHAFGVGYPVPPRERDSEYRYNQEVWEKVSPAVDFVVPAGSQVNIIVELVQEDKKERAGFDAISVEYLDGGMAYSDRWNTRYVFDSLGGQCEEY